MQIRVKSGDSSSAIDRKRISRIVRLIKIVIVLCFGSWLISSCTYTQYEGSEHLLQYDPPRMVTAENSAYTVDLHDVEYKLGMVLIKFYMHEKKTREHGEQLYDRIEQKSQWRLDNLELAYDGPAGGKSIRCKSVDDLLTMDADTALTNEQGVALFRAKLPEGFVLTSQVAKGGKDGLLKYVRKAEPVEDRLKAIYVSGEGRTVDGVEFSYRDSTYHGVELVDVSDGIGSFIRKRLLKTYTVEINDLEKGKAVKKAEATLRIQSEPKALLSRQFGEEGLSTALKVFPLEQVKLADKDGLVSFHVLRNGKYKLDVTAPKYKDFSTVINKFNGDMLVELYRGKGEEVSRISSIE